MLAAPSKESPEDKNYLRNAEMYFEENYNDIDGRMSTQNKLTPKDDTLPQPELFDDSKDSIPASTQKESVREKLKHANENIISSADQKTTAPTKKQQLDR